jgi:hypothetical protein
VGLTVARSGVAVTLTSVGCDGSDWSRPAERAAATHLSLSGATDRHHIQERDDARRYEIGVLGLASLILTQLRREHADHFAQE